MINKDKLNPEVGQQDHYTRFKIQPIDYIIENELDFLEGNVIKYISRYKYKDGIKDLKKLRQYVDWLIEREELLHDRCN